jgi:hypothetical protein
MGAHLHDIGKLALPDGILLKPGPLTTEERVFLQRHVQTGYDLIKQIPFLADAAELIHTCRERFDGSGYLRGLKAEQIPIGSRIFAVADMLDEISSDRPSRSALPFKEGFRVIDSESGRFFDPQICGAFFSIPKETWPSTAWNQQEVPFLSSRLRSGGAAAPPASPLSSRRGYLSSSAAPLVAGYSLGLDWTAHTSATYAVLESEDFDVWGRTESTLPIGSARGSSSE